MAAAAAPPALPAPPAIAVTVDTAAADRSIVLAASESLVAATPFLPWVPSPAGPAGAPATVRLAQFRAVRAFVRRCTLGQAAGDHAAFQLVECMMFGLTSAFWSRLLTALRDVQLFSRGPFLMWPQFVQSYRNCDLSAIDMCIHSGDLALGESWETPAIPAGPAPNAPRGRAAPPALPAAPVPAVPGPADLEFLSMVTLDQSATALASEPLGLWADLICHLGPCATRASRLTQIAPVRTNALLMINALKLRLLGAATGQTPHPLLAINVMDLLRDATLPLCLAPPNLSDVEMRSELRDGLRYIRSEGERKAVEVSRIHFVGTRYIPPPHLLLMARAYPLQGGSKLWRWAASFASPQSQGVHLHPMGGLT